MHLIDEKYILTIGMNALAITVNKKKAAREDSFNQD